jgi:predicted RNA-binding protein YlqC (UPF0109 family)
MSKSKSDTSPAALQKQKEALLAQIAALEVKENEQKQVVTNKVAIELDTFPKTLGKILGREVSIADAINFMKQRERGTFGTVAPATAGSSESRSFRLTDESKIALRQDMLQRALDLKAGKTPVQVSTLAVKYGTTAATIGNYKPSNEEVAAGTLAIEAAAPAATA